MSLAWGTGLMAAEFATEHQARQAAVIGCGSVGLTCARQLQRRGFDVTIYALAVPPNVTSNMSLAGFTPTSGLVETDRRTPRVGCAVSAAPPTSRTGSCSCSPGRISACRGSTTTR